MPARNGAFDPQPTSRATLILGQWPDRALPRITEESIQLLFDAVLLVALIGPDRFGLCGLSQVTFWTGHNRMDRA